MSRGQVGSVAQQFRRIFGSGTVAGLAEWELLRRYLERGDEDAFGAIVTRHGPMVLGVCRRVLGDPAESEDAFQVTFLTLARKANTLGEGDAIGSWLYGVAHRVALRARTASARRRNLERKAPPAEPASLDEAENRELGSIVAEELAGLPSKYRAPMILCYIEGLTHEEAARQLGWPIGTVKGRLARARDKLKGRLSRRGMAPSHAPGLLALIRGGPTHVPTMLAARTTRAALDLAAGRAAEGLSASATAILEAGAESMIWPKFKATLAALFVFGGGAAVLAYQAAKEPGEASKPAGGQAGPARKANPAADKPREIDPPARPSASKAPAEAGGFGGFGEIDLLARIREEAARPTPRTPRDAAILAKLNEPVSLNFTNETPLEDVKKYIEQSTQDETAGLPTGIPIYVDPQGLQDADKTMASTVSINLEGVALKRTLTLMLKQLGLAYRVEGGFMLIYAAADGEAGSPMALMLEKADRGELSKAEYKELIEILKLRQEIHKLRVGGGLQ